MSVHPATPLFAALVVAMTLLLCALLPKALRDASVLLQYRSSQLQESILRMNSSRQMSSTVYYTREDSACPVSDKVVEAHCHIVVKNLGLTVANKVPTVIDIPWQATPSGCFIDAKGKLFYNKQAGETKCTDGQKCICSDSTGTTKAFLIDSGSCPAGEAVAKSECVQRADALGVNYIAANLRLNTAKWPAGCFYRAKNKRLYYNSKSTAIHCGANKECICFGKQRNTDGSGNPENTPPPPPAAYTKECGTCPSVLSSMADCKAVAEAKGILFSHMETFSDLNALPAGCFTIKKKLSYNSNLAGKGTCDSSTRTCICAGTLPSAYNISTSTCPTQERLPRCQCTEMATILGMNYDNFEETTDNNLPAGCFLFKRQLWYNHEASSTTTCSDKRTCICAR